MHLFEKYRAWKGTSRCSRKIFVLGCGRSGTHWIGRMLDSHPNIAATIERPDIFDLVKRMALLPDTRPLLMPKLISKYRFAHARVAPLHYADKSHPNIWMAENLAGAFPNSRFVGIQRSVFGTVASMLKHKQVLAWFRRWREFPAPNQFLSITKENVGTYEELPTIAKCALRWRSHERRLGDLRSILGSRIIVVSYEDMIRDVRECQEKLQGFLGLKDSFSLHEVKTESLDRWRDELGADDVAIIERVLKE